MGEDHSSLWIISKGLVLTNWELTKGNLTCLPKRQEWHTKDGVLLHRIELEYTECKMSFPWWPKRKCQILEDKKAECGEDGMVAPCVEWKG